MRLNSVVDPRGDRYHSLMFREYTDLLSENRNYRRLWFGYVISQLGDWFNLIASAALVASLTEGGQPLSYLFLVRFLPLFLFSPVAGLLNDRFDRRYVMIASDVLRAATVACFLFVRSADQLWLLYALTATQFALSALFEPGRAALLANIVKKERLITANALDSLTWSTMLALGSLLGGLATAAFGITTAFVLDVFTFLLSASFIYRIDPAVFIEAREYISEDRGGFRAIVDGFLYLTTVPVLLVIALVKSAGTLVYGAVNVVEISLAEEVYPIVFTTFDTVFGEGGTITLALIYFFSGIGTGFGPLLMRRWMGDSIPQLRRGITISTILVAIGTMAMSVDLGLGWILLMSMVRTVGSGTAWTFSSALLQITTPDRVRGRVFAFEFAMLTLFNSISIYWAGFAQDRLGYGLFDVIFVSGIVGIVVLGFWLLFHWRTYRLPLVPTATTTS